MDKKLSSFIENYFFYPTILHKLISLLLLPISLIYYIIALLRKKLTSRKNFDIKIISIGNLVSGGSGKTPFSIALIKYLESKYYKDIYVILRGYKRESSGLIQVSLYGKILCDVKSSGDEAMLIALQTKASIIVSEKREVAIEYAKKNKAKVIILDDAYRFNFDKFDILLEPKITPYFNFVLPSGYYRFPISFYKQCDLHLKEDIEYKRNVYINHMEVTKGNVSYILATAIANPARLELYLPDNIAYRYYLPDHAEFDCNKLLQLLKTYNATHILMTQKDYVKCDGFKLPFAILELSIQIDSKVLNDIEIYLKS